MGKMNKFIFAFIPLVIIVGCASEENEKRNVVAQVNTAQISNSELESSIPENISSDVKLALKNHLG